MKLIPFQHRYAKLAKPEFTTVRGPSFALHLRPSTVAAARTPDAEFPVGVVGRQGLFELDPGTEAAVRAQI